MIRRRASTLLLLLAASCATASTGVDTDGGAPPATSAPAADAGAGVPSPPASVPDSGADADTDAGRGGTYRDSLAVCWTDASCKRALTVAHGGDWTPTGNPYDSNAAIAAAYANGADGVKIDVRITSDNVPVISHSSPLELSESVDCYGRKIEEMTAAQVTGCHRVPSTTERFQRLDEVLTYARGKLVVQLTVKRAEDIAPTIAAVLAQGAEGFAFFEISTDQLQTLIPTITGSGQVYYLINIDQLSEVDTLLDTIKSPRAIMFEFAANVDVSALVTARLHPAGVRSFTYDKQTVTTAAVKALFDGGFDVVSTNATGNAVLARKQVNGARGISPP